MDGEKLDILILLFAANGAPIIAERVFRAHFGQAVDVGRCWTDGMPVFGPSKTWRGLVGSVAFSTALSSLLGYGTGFGLVFGLLAMIGDLCSSFIKRRMGLPSGARRPGLDQLPEALLPAAYAVTALGCAWWWAVLLALLFTLLALLVSRPLYWLGIRKRPH